MDTGLTGRTVVVTGAGSGIGRRSVDRFLDEGARVIAVDRSAESLAQVASMRGVVSVVPADVSNESDVDCIADAWNEAGGVDVLVNVAGVGMPGTIADTSLDDWEHMFRVNSRGPFLTCRAAVRSMRARGRGGVIVNVSSAAALAAVGARAAYSSSKAAVLALTRAITMDHAADGIRANVIAPGTVDTPWIARVIGDVDDPTAVRTAMADRQLIGRLGEPDEIADAIVYLASDRSTFMHGSTLVVDGGFTAR